MPLDMIVVSSMMQIYMTDIFTKEAPKKIIWAKNEYMATLLTTAVVYTQQAVSLKGTSEKEAGLSTQIQHMDCRRVEKYLEDRQITISDTKGQRMSLAGSDPCHPKFTAQSNKHLPSWC